MLVMLDVVRRSRRDYSGRQAAAQAYFRLRLGLAADQHDASFERPRLAKRPISSRVPGCPNSPRIVRAGAKTVLVYLLSSHVNNRIRRALAMYPMQFVAVWLRIAAMQSDRWHPSNSAPLQDPSR